MEPRPEPRPHEGLGRGQGEAREQYPEGGGEETAGQKSKHSAKPLQFWLWYCTPYILELRQNCLDLKAFLAACIVR